MDEAYDDDINNNDNEKKNIEFEVVELKKGNYDELNSKIIKTIILTMVIILIIVFFIILFSIFLVSTNDKKKN